MKKSSRTLGMLGLCFALCQAVCVWAGEGKTGATAKAKATPTVGVLDASDGSYRLTLDQLPAAVKEAFLKQAGGNPIKGISMEMHDGKPVYDCDVFIEGKKYEVVADENGKLLTKPIVGTAGEETAKPVKDVAAKKAEKAKAAKGEKAKGGKAKGKTAKGEFQKEFKVDKANLADRGNNEYFVLQPGYRLIFKSGEDTLRITVLDETKMVDGVKTRIVEEWETEGGKLSEISRNYFAIDQKTGDVYYFGEALDEYDPETGKVISHEGAWESGVDGAKFGLGLPGKPKVGDKYYQEMAPKVAMDRAEVVSVSETAKVPAGTFEDCLKTEESSDLESGTSVKVYAPDVGLIKDDEFELAKKEVPLPEAVDKAFKAAFPKAEIEKLDVDEENGVMVYDFEFKNGAVEQETDIAGDGTILEVTLVVEAKDVPEKAMKAMEKQAGAGAKFGRIEKVDISYETKDGKPVKLAKSVRHYYGEFQNGDKRGEAMVTEDGEPVEG